MAMQQDTSANRSGAASSTVDPAEVAKFSKTPKGLIELRVPAQNYAVFRHDEHVAKIGATYSAIWNQWLPDHNRIAADGASIERHRETFDPRTGLGGVDIWIPLREGAGA